MKDIVIEEYKWVKVLVDSTVLSSKDSERKFMEV